MKIKGIYSSLNPAEKKAADFILQNPQFVAERHISDVAKTAGVVWLPCRGLLVGSGMRITDLSCRSSHNNLNQEVRCFILT